MSKKIKLIEEKTNKCDRCIESKCCQYVTQCIDKPTTIQDFDLLMWQVSHRNVHLFKDEDGWFLLFVSTCEHLQDNGHCGIYETRPLICRDHDNSYCEFDVSIKEGSEYYFETDKELDKYCRKRFKGWDKRFKKKTWKKNAEPMLS